MSFELLQSMVNAPNLVTLEIGISSLKESTTISVNAKDVETIQQIIQEAQFASLHDMVEKLSIYIVKG